MLSGHRKPKIRPLQGSQLQHYLGSFKDSGVPRLSKEPPSSHAGNSPSPIRRSTSAASTQLSHRKRKSPFSSSELQIPSSHVVSATIKVYANVLHPDVLYKAVHVTYSTYAVHVVKELIDRFAVNEEDKDPAMFCLVAAGDDSDRVQMLEDNDRPLAVQADWPNDSYCFRLCRRPDYQRSPNGKFNQYSGEMTVTITTPFPGTCSCMKLDFDDETTSQLMAERVLLEYDASLDPSLFGLYETWIEEPSRRKKARQLRDSDLMINIMQRVASGKISLQLSRRKAPPAEKKSRSRRPSSDSSASGITHEGSMLSLPIGSTDDVSRGSSPSYPDWLDSDWEQRYDETSQKQYYVNKITRESSWINPSSLRQPNMDPDLPFGWERGHDKKSKRIYYINHLTRETTWKNPARRSVDVHSLKNAQCREFDAISPDSGTFVETPSPKDEIDISGKSPTKDIISMNHDGRDFPEDKLKQGTDTGATTQSTHGSVPVPSGKIEHCVDVHSTVPENLQQQDARNSDRKDKQQIVSPLPSPAMDSDATNLSMFLWTPQPERRGNSSFDRSIPFNRSERSRRSARLRGFMLQSLNQGMAGVMQEIASEGRGGLWTPQENRRRPDHQRPQRRHSDFSDTDRRGSESIENEMLLESLPKPTTPVGTVETAKEENETTEDEARTVVGQASAVRSAVLRFEGKATSEQTLGSELRQLVGRRSGGSRFSGDPQKKIIDPQAAKAREELKRLSRKMSPSSANESDTSSTATAAVKGSRENTPTARVTPNNHVHLESLGNTGGQPVEKLNAYLETVSSLKTVKTSSTVELRDRDNMTTRESDPQVITISHSHSPGDQTFPDVSPSSGTTHPSAVPSPESKPSSIPNSTGARQPAVSTAAENSDLNASPLATITVDPSGSVTARAASYGKLTAVATTETTEVTTTTEVTEIATSPPKRTKTITTEKKTVATAKIIPDDIAGLRSDLPKDKQERSAEATYWSEETRHVVQTSPNDKDDDSFMLRPEESTQLTKEGAAKHHEEQGTSNENGNGKMVFEPLTNTPEIAEASSSLKSADPQTETETEQQSAVKENDIDDTKPSSSSESESNPDGVASKCGSTKTGTRADGSLDDDPPFVSYSHRRRFSAAANLELNRTGGGSEDIFTTRTAATGWRSKLGKLYADNNDDEWIQKRRRRRSASWRSFDSRETTNSEKEEHEETRAVSKKAESNISFEPEDIMARRRRFFELKSLSLREDSLSTTSQRKAPTPARSGITTSRGCDAASLKQAKSPKVQLKETGTPSRVLTVAKLESPAVASTDSGKTASDDINKLGDSEDKSRWLIDNQSTQRLKQEDKSKKATFQSSSSPKEDLRPQDHLESRLDSAKPAETLQPASDEKKHSPSLSTPQRSDEFLGQDQVVDSTSSSQPPLSSSDSPLTIPLDSGPRNISLARRKFLEDRSRSDAKRSDSPSAVRRVQRSRSFQLRSAWLASTKNPSQSKKDTTVADRETSGRRLSCEERPTLSPPLTRSSPQLGSRSPLSGRSSPKSPKERLKQLKAELEQIESDVYRLLPGQPDKEGDVEL